jgi:ribosomal protein S18 acetylase RimI-like enzyme
MNLRFRLGQAYDRVRTGDARGVVRLLRKRLYSDTLRIQVRKETTDADAARTSEAEHPIRIAAMADIEAVLDPERGGARDAGEVWQRRLRRHVAATVGPDRCYVADFGERGPSFMQYLFFPEDNDLLQSRFPDLGSRLEPGEAMVEYLYVSPDARLLPFVTSCLAQVAAEARRRGASSIITYAQIGNKGALFSFQLAGFRPFAIRRSRYRFFRRSVSYEPYTQSSSNPRSSPGA